MGTIGKVVIFNAGIVALVAGAMWVLTPSQDSVIENAVRAKLIDPASAMFRNIAVAKDGSFCGEVNSKNHFGGYAGYSWFTGVLLPKHQANVIAIDGADDRIVAAVCAGGTQRP